MNSHFAKILPGPGHILSRATSGVFPISSRADPLISLVAEPISFIFLIEKKIQLGSTQKDEKKHKLIEKNVEQEKIKF